MDPNFRRLAGRILRVLICFWAVTNGFGAVQRDLGLDVSHYDGSTGISQSLWNQIYSQSNRFAFIKGSEGLTGPDDTAMTNNVNRAIAAGLLAGVYHVAHAENRPTTSGAILEADVYGGTSRRDRPAFASTIGVRAGLAEALWRDKSERRGTKRKMQKMQRQRQS
jgi:hypothetical protein